MKGILSHLCIVFFIIVLLVTLYIYGVVPLAEDALQHYQIEGPNDRQANSLNAR